MLVSALEACKLLLASIILLRLTIEPNWQCWPTGKRTKLLQPNGNKEEEEARGKTTVESGQLTWRLNGGGATRRDHLMV